MSDLDESFAQLLDRQPTDGERQRLYRVRDALNIKPTDAVWTLLMVLEHYQTMYEADPGVRSLRQPATRPRPFVRPRKPRRKQPGKRRRRGS